MSWSINEVARLTGLTSRALRHYDAIGLLKPAWTAEGGRRHYQEEELLKLQEILLLRDLGLSLEDIGAAVATRRDDARAEVLARHRRQLQTERDRLDRLITTVDRTIDSLTGGEKMAPQEIFDGLIHNPYEAEARQTWGDEAVDTSYAKLRALSKEDRELLTSGKGFERAHADLAKLMATGATVSDPAVQEVVAFHYKVVSLAWTPNREAYKGLGDMYLADERFRHNIGGGDDDLVKFLADAMHVYADANLA
ncbi:MAG TPA: TipAS antibiotic-recognition domain-containing protein [Trueperaceae bacterium]|nr:TipAS antibiotic-recognition domain-containing protein [Trueperaceae bacterium]